MKSWLKKTVSLGRKNDSYDAVPSTAPTPERGLLGSNEPLSSEATPVRLDMERAGGSQGEGRRRVPSSKTTSQHRHHSRGHSGGSNKSGVGMVRQKSKASSHDLDMAVSAMGIQGNEGVNARDAMNKSGQTSVSSHQSHSSVTAGQRSATYSSNVVSSQHQDDAMVARMVAEEERAYYASLQRAMTASMEQQQQQQIVNGAPPLAMMDPSRLPDMNLAIALAESQFAARQADELVKARESVFEAAVNKAMEESISSADYDHLLRDIKMWTIDLDAASDDVVTALNMISKRRRELAGKLEKALEKGDTLRVAKMLWEEEKLPEIQLRIEELQENMVPIGLAASDLQALRKKIMETYPPIVESQKARDAIIEELFRALKNLKLKWSNPGSSSDYSIQTSEDCQDSSELRDLIVSLVEDAKRIPKVPDKVVKEAKVMVHTAFAEQQASVDAKSDVSDVYSHGRMDNESTRAPSECKTEVSSTPTEMQHLVKSSNVDSSVDMSSDIHVRSSSNEEEIKKMKNLELKDKKKPKARSSMATVPQPFNLSQNRPPRMSTSSKQKSDGPIRRVPAFFTLHHEILSDRGVVNQTVDWQSREYSIESFASQYLTVPAPVNVDEFYSEDVHELVDYVKKHAKSFGKQLKSANIPSSSVHEEKWYTMCEVAGAVEGLEAASERFLTWNVPEPESITESCHSLKAIVSQTLSIIADTAYAHDSLRVAIKKHKLPWKESLISQVRWDAQHAAFVIMRAAIDCAEEAERKRGAFKRQKNVLKPLGQAVIATFSVHQLSGGFGGEAAEICDQLVELTVHYARQLDPKWFRGTKVVR
jgi:hypothetical protein